MNTRIEDLLKDEQEYDPLTPPPSKTEQPIWEPSMKKHLNTLDRYARSSKATCSMHDHFFQTATSHRSKTAREASCFRLTEKQNHCKYNDQEKVNLSSLSASKLVWFA